MEDEGTSVRDRLVGATDEGLDLRVGGIGRDDRNVTHTGRGRERENTLR